MKKFMFWSLLLIVSFAMFGCCSGAPATIDRSAAPQAVTAVNTLGFRPEVQATLGIPIDVTDCVVETGTNVLKDLVGGARCVLNKLVPIVNETPAPSYAPAAAPCAEFVDVQETYMVPETRMVPRTRTVRKAVVPVPQSAPAPRSGCEPPPSPVACTDGSCGIPR